VPYTMVRMAGQRGDCYARQYRRGAEYLLLLRHVDAKTLTPYWIPLAPLNEQVRGSDDAWVTWVRARARGEALPGAARDSSAPAAAPAAAPVTARVPLLQRGDLRATGWALLATVLVATQDRNIARSFADSGVQANQRYKSLAGSLTTVHERSLFAYSLVAYAGGLIFRSAPVADGGLHTAEAIAVGTVIGSFLKSTTGRARPRAADDDPYDFRFGKGYTSGDYRSFPSLHEIGSFSAAAALTAEVARHAPRAGRVVGVLAYGTAGAVGVSRMYNGEHWASDVVLGSAIGVFLGKRIVDNAHSGPPSKVDRFLLGGLAVTPSQTRITLYDRDF
ncbi:MAG: phosphatase PAP2 family protein, partial [Gemmatimonadaceae bacterium]